MAELDLVTRMQVDDSVVSTNEIDESLYSRQLYVLGHEAMKRMGASNVLIMGLKGLGVETAKNIALAGVKSITLYDPVPAAIADLSAQFFLRPEDVGKPRDQVTVARVSELNSYVPITVLESAKGPAENLSELGKFQVVIMTNTPLRDQIAIGDYCHQKGIHVIATECFGLFGSVFCDFGGNFTVMDATGENPAGGIISAIDEEGIVSVHEDQRHGLEDGDFVTFSEVQGMEPLNGCTPRKITVKGPYTFSIGNVTGLGSYIRGGLYQQVKMPKFLDFKSISESIKDPEFVFSDFAKFDRPQQLHLGFQAIHAFVQKNGRYPIPFNEDDATIVLGSAKKFASELGIEVEFDEKLIKELSYQAVGELNAMAAFFGGIAAQEALKAVSGKFHPIKQWMYFDSLESLPENSKRDAEQCAPTGSRYDGQIAVFGREFQEKIANLKQFLVGAGAIGCEMLKNWAMIGLGTGPNGKIFVTDMDSIERSNLNRQFLFRPIDVGKMKSDSAARAVTEMNPDLKGKIQSMKDRVSPDTTNVFNEDFWRGLDGVTNALDNVEGRTYVDQRCVFFQKPLLESGTLGTKGNTQVVVPHLTESYSESADPPEKSIPMCITRNFPNKIEHCIHWARYNIFQMYFSDTPTLVNMYLTKPNYLEVALREPGGPKIPNLEKIRDSLTTDRPRSFEDCIAWARLRFEHHFTNEIQQLLHSFPKDYETSAGTPFWSGPKRAPDPLKFDPSNKMHYDFIVAAANLHAFNYDIKGLPGKDRETYLRVLDNVIVPDFSPDSKVKIQTDDKEPDPNAGAFSDENEAQKVVSAIPPSNSLAGFQLQPVDFEKDDDTNHHIDFITVASNLRAENYKIATLDRHQTKQIAGKIIPAIATTTALVTGLVILELYKVIDGKTDIEQYKNGFANLALPLFTFGEPIASRKLEYKGPNGAVKLDKTWARFEIDNVTLQEFLDYFEKEHGLSVSMLSSDVSLLYANFHGPTKNKEKLPLKMKDLVEKVSKKQIPEHQTEIRVEMMAEDADGNDVDDLPFAKVSIK